MNRTFLLVACAAFVSVPAFAQMPPGSYAQSCRDIRVEGDRMSAICATRQGTAQRSTISLDNCPGSIANDNGRLTCEGGGRGSSPRRGYGPDSGYPEREYGPPRSRDYGQPDDDRRRYGRPPAQNEYPPEGRQGPRPYREGGVGLPPGSWQASCVSAQMQGSMLIARCRDTQGGSRQTSIDVRSCRAIANRNGQLVCG